MNKKNPNQCCPKFDPKPWQEKTHLWENKLFIKDTIPQFLHIPFPSMIGKMIQRQWKKAQDAGAAPELKDFLWLSYCLKEERQRFFLQQIGLGGRFQFLRAVHN